MKWTQTRNSAVVSVWESGPYKIKGYSQAAGKTLRRVDWRVEVYGVELDASNRFDSAKGFAESHLSGLKVDAAYMVGSLLNAPGYPARDWHPLRFQHVRDWAVDNGYIQRYRIELKVTDAGRTWFDSVKVLA